MAVGSAPSPALHHVIVVIDVTASGSRDDQLLLRMRSDLRAIILETLRRQSLAESVAEWADLGDGCRLIMGVHVTPSALLDPFVHNLSAGLREHRKAASAAARLRLRLALHMGLLHEDPGGWTGAPLVHAARLIDAEPVRQAARLSDRADLVVVMSEAVFEGVVRHGFGLDAAACSPVTIDAKETRATAWIHVPGLDISATDLSAPVGAAPPAAVAVPPAEKPRRSGLLNPYIRRARLEPLVLCTLPLVLLALLLLPGLPAVVVLLVVATVLPLLVDQMTRDRGRQVEVKLFQRWGGKPTTQLLRWGGPTDHARQGQVHAELQRLVGPSLVLPTPAEEHADPQRADDIYDAAVAVLRARTRLPSAAGALTFLENRNYGFRRNTLGLRPYGIGLSLVGVVAAVGFALRSTVSGREYVYAATATGNAALLYFWSVVVRPAWVGKAAWTYAQRLIEAVDATPGSFDHLHELR